MDAPWKSVKLRMSGRILWLRLRERVKFAAGDRNDSGTKLRRWSRAINSKWLFKW